MFQNLASQITLSSKRASLVMMVFNLASEKVQLTRFNKAGSPTFKRSTRNSGRQSWRSMGQGGTRHSSLIASTVSFLPSLGGWNTTGRYSLSVHFRLEHSKCLFRSASPYIMQARCKYIEIMVGGGERERMQSHEVVDKIPTIIPTLRIITTA